MTTTEQPDPVRVIGTVVDAHGNPLEVAVYRGTVNIAGRHLGKREAAQFARLFVVALWEAATWAAHRQRDGAEETRDA